MRRNNGFLSFFIFLIFLTYVFYLTYGFFRQRKEVTNNIISKLKIRKEDFYQGSEKASVTENNQPQVKEEKAQVEETANTPEKTEESKPAENQTSNNNNTEDNTPSETPEPKVDTPKKAYIRVATYNKKLDADEALKKLDGNFRIRNSKTSSGKEVFIIVSKTVSSNEELEKLKEKVKTYNYQIINPK